MAVCDRVARQRRRVDVITALIDREVAFLTCKTDAVPFGSDTFVLRDGKIVVQTVAMPAG